MAATPQISGFNPDEVRAGLRLAMQVGLPVTPADQPTFYMPATVTTDGSHKVDSGGTPYLPTYRPDVARPTPIKVPCAVEYVDGEGKILAFGTIVPARVKLTFLDQDYAKVKGFDFVAIGGTKYFYKRDEPPLGLISVGIHIVHCMSEDEG
jgi:hypothetical protein